ncbi:MAG TPA: SRPBCC family protein [Candidatus Dormibacteraeota bacterium]|nr:SRPBCC family protein [Candidatus Dormibacteraeota bacterium]
MGEIKVELIGFWYTVAVLLFGIPAAVLLLLGLVRTVRRDAPTIQSIERAAAISAIGAVLLLVTLTLFLAQWSWEVGLAFGVLSAAYVAYSLPEATRRYAFQCSVTVRCTPDEAFAFVSDARNWPRYFAEMTVKGPLDMPPHVGSVIHVSVMLPTVSLSADERVTAYEPPKRFATSMVETRGEGIYDFMPAGDGTEIAYSSRGVIGTRHALLGNAVLKPLVVRRMRTRREAAMRAIRSILEGQPAGSV